MRTYLKYLHKNYFAALMLPLLVFSACKKEQTVLTPDFDVTVDKTTYAVNEPITFNFTGTGDVVTFFSGAPGKEYKYKDRYRVDGKAQMQFTSYRQGASTQANTLSLLWSKDFTGIYDIDNLQQATWTDITSRATLSTGVDNTASGVIDLTDLQTPDVPVYIAFKYAAKKDAVVAQPTWTIKNIAVNNITADGTIFPIATSANSWGTLNVLNPANLWSSTTAQIQFTGGAINIDDNEDWIITQPPLQLDRVQRVFGQSIKASPTATLTKYIFAGYIAPGTYTVTFEALNANKWDIKTIVKELTITVQ
jgi:hypothetical protein